MKLMSGLLVEALRGAVVSDVKLTSPFALLNNSS